jgi:AraC-like DNA-binding protein
VSPPVIAVLLSARDARHSLRRAIPRDRARVRACRTPAALGRIVAGSLADAVVLDVRMAGAREALADLNRLFPRVPRFAYTSFRPDDAELLRICVTVGRAHPIVEGVEDGVLGDLIMPRTASAARLARLEDAPRLLRLSDPLQRRAWVEVLRRVGGRLRATDIAGALRVSREHLSRQFGAGGAPNLKRVIDLARAATAADLLLNPGHTARGVARILGFASSSHLSGAARRVCGVTATALSDLGPEGVLEAFIRGRTRSRR